MIDLKNDEGNGDSMFCWFIFVIIKIEFKKLSIQRFSDWRVDDVLLHIWKCDQCVLDKRV